MNKIPKLEIPKLEKLLESESFRNKTAMYVGAKEISKLRAFLDGVDYSFIAYELAEENLFDGFNDWIANFYGWKASTAGWTNIILNESDNDESKAVDEFFRVYDQFRDEKRVSNKLN